MNALQENVDQTVLHRWSQTMASMAAWQWKLLETPYQVGLKIVEVALRLPGNLGADLDEPADTARQTVDKFVGLEALALERARRGLALPSEIYQLPYRNRMDWSKLPEWARPIDPEVFADCGHEG